ncbi:hypothetical protein [Phenylobacterium ferrooxidans]|uniref:Peptidase C39 domain-containing protein n=1 Tax=Phenylobacterium ferrooxidans TaxID=2982689 RepID=A0ABW6CLS3_9CAUL
MEPVPYLAQTTAGGCGPCSFIMVARYFDPGLSLTEEDALKEFGFGDRPRHFALAPCFFHAGKALGLKAQIKSMDRATLRGELEEGPVIVLHRASEEPGAVPHFSVALAGTKTHITRHDPGFGAGLIDDWERFERLWGAVKVDWFPFAGNQAVILRPEP